MNTGHGCIWLKGVWSLICLYYMTLSKNKTKVSIVGVCALIAQIKQVKTWKKKGKLPARIFSLAMWEVYDHKSSEVFPFVCRFSKVREICWSCITDLVIGLYKTLVGHNFNCFFSLTLSCHFSFTHSHTPLEMTVAICRVIITCYNSLHIDFTKYWHENLLINSWQLLMVPCRKKKLRSIREKNLQKL